MRALFRLLSAFLFGNILAGTEIIAVLLPANSSLIAGEGQQAMIYTPHCALLIALSIYPAHLSLFCCFVVQLVYY